MSSEWSAIPLDELTDGTTITYGVVKPGDECPNGVKFVRGGDVVAGRILTAQLRTITTDVSQQYARTLLHGGELLVSLVGNPGEVALVPASLKGANIARQVGLVRIDPAKAEANYVQYYLRSKTGRDVLLAHSKGSVQQVINLKDLKSVKVPLPPISVQRNVAGFMQALDDRITLLRETNATLEAIAQALFKSWFVDFDPVRAKMEGRTPEGMDEATAALFPDGFETLELGEVPKGWQRGPLNEQVEGVYDGPHATPPEATEGSVFLGIKNLTGTALNLGDVRYIADSDWERWTKRVTPRTGDIVFSYEATLGFFALIPPGLRCCLGRRLALVRPKERDGFSHFWLHQFVAAPFQALLEKHTIHGATVNRIALKSFPDLSVLVPPLELRRAFDSIVAGLWERIHCNGAKVATLSILRDTLLPRLISGQLRLPEAQAELNDALV